jgi:hypothetical protein
MAKFKELRSRQMRAQSEKLLRQEQRRRQRTYYNPSQALVDDSADVVPLLPTFINREPTVEPSSDLVVGPRRGRDPLANLTLGQRFVYMGWEPAKQQAYVRCWNERPDRHIGHRDIFAVFDLAWRLAQADAVDSLNLEMLSARLALMESRTEMLDAQIDVLEARLAALQQEGALKDDGQELIELFEDDPFDDQDLDEAI